MPPLVRLYLRSVAIGFALAAAFVALLLWADPMGFGGLVLRARPAALPVALLVLFNGIVFSGVQFGIAVMALQDRPAERKAPPGGGLAPAVLPPRRPDRRV
jgi:hypothetical protein